MPNTKTSSITGNPASLQRHRRKCVICKHKDREDIESDFLHWHSADNIVCDYDLPQARTLYRHVHATGLYAKRQQDMRYAAAHIVDNAENVKPTAHAVLQAMRACTLINDQGVWVDPPKHIVHHPHRGRRSSRPRRLRGSSLNLRSHPTRARASRHSSGSKRASRHQFRAHF